MQPLPIHILLIEDDPGDVNLLKEELNRASSETEIRIEWVENLEHGLEYLEAHAVSAVLLDLSIPDGNSGHCVERLLTRVPNLPVLILAEAADEQCAVKEVQSGAQDYLIKGQMDGRLLLRSIRHAIRRMHLMEELRAREERTRQLFEAGLIGMAITSPDKRFIEVNDRICDMLGYARAELMEMSWDHMTHPDDLAADVACFSRLLSGEINTYTLEKRFFHKTGRQVYTVISVNAVRGPGSPVHYLVSLLEDITERKRAEQALRASEERFRSALKNLPVFVFNQDRELRYTWVANPHPGFTNETMLGKTDADLLAPDEAQRVTEVKQRVLATGVRARSEIKRTVDGTVLFYELVVEPLRDSAGTITGVAGASMDITERKQAEQTIQQNEKRFRALIENGRDNISLLDKNGILLWESPATVSTLGYPPDEFTGRNIFQLLHPDDLERVARSFSQLLETPGSRKGDIFRLRHHSGEWHWVEALASNLLEEPAVEAIVINYRDITERKEVENALQESELRYRTLVDQLPAIVYIDELSNGASQTKFVSPQMDRMLGYTPDEWIRGGAHSWENSIHPDDRMRVVGEYRRCVETGQGMDCEYRLAARNGHFVWVRDRSTTLTNPDGRPRLIHGIIFDVTAAKQLEDALQERERRYRSLFEDSPVALFEEDFSEVKQRLDRLRQEGVTDFHAFFKAHPQLVAECAALVRVVDANKAAVELFQAEEKSNLIGNLSSIINEASLIDFAEELVQIAEGETRFCWEGINQTMTGQRLDISLTWSLVPGHEDQFSRVIVSVANITERKQAQAALARRVTELEAINRVSTVLRAADSLQEMLSRVLDETLAVIHTEAGTIKLYDPSTNMLIPMVSRGWFGEIDDLAVRPGEGVSGVVFSTGEAYLAREFLADAATLEQARSRIPVGWGGTCVPIRSGQIVTGVLFTAVQLPRELSNAEIHLLNTLAELAGNAIHRMQLHEEALQQLDRLNALQEIDRAISSSFDLRLTLDVVIQQVTRLLKADAVDVLLVAPEAFRLEFASGKGFHTSGIMSTRLGLGEGLPGMVAHELRTLQIENLSQIRDKFSRLDLLAAENFVAYIGVPLIVKGRIKGVLEIFHRSPLKPDAGWLKFLETLAGQAAIAIDNSFLFQDVQRSNNELVVAYDATIEGWVSALDLRYKEAKGHSERVTQMTLKLACLMGIRDEKLVHIRRGALLHDIGKMVVPDHVLMNTGELSGGYQELIRQHPQYAYDILSPIHYLREALDIPYCHHERWDGSGYPRGLTGEQIPLAARIFTVVDVWDSLTSHRPYRSAWSKPKTLEYIAQHSGSYFDPRVVEVFLKYISDLDPGSGS